MYLVFVLGLVLVKKSQIVYEIIPKLRYQIVEHFTVQGDFENQWKV